MLNGERMDIFIKSTEKDFLSFIELQKDIQKYNKLNGEVYVSVPKNNYSKFKEIIDPSFILMCDEEILHFLNYHGAYLDSWCSQQAIKLLAYNFVKNNSYLVLDSNTLLTQKLNTKIFKKNKRYIYAIDIKNDCEEDIEFEILTSRFLNIKNFKLIGLTNVNQVFITDNVKALSAYVEDIKKDTFVNILMKSIPPMKKGDSPTPWTEFHLYGLFCAKILGRSRNKTIFEQKNNVVWITPETPFNEIGNTIRNNYPLFIKMHQERIYHQNKVLSDHKYKSYVKEIRATIDSLERN